MALQSADKANLAKSWKKHGVTPRECEQTFFNVPLVVADDVAHSTAECPPLASRR